MPLTSFPCPKGWATASAPSLTLSTIPPSPNSASLSPRAPNSPNSPIGVSSAWLAEENNLFVESLSSLPKMPRRPGAKNDDPSMRVSPDFEKIRSEIAIHRRLDYLARRRHAAASFAAQSQRTMDALQRREEDVREFERQRQTEFEAEKQRRETEFEAARQRQKEERQERLAMWEEEKELYLQTSQTREELWDRQIKEKQQRLLEEASKRDADRKAFLQRKAEQDDAKDRYKWRGIELREAERTHKLNLKHQAETEAARARAAKSRAVAEKVRQCLEKSKADTTAEYKRQIEERERQVSANLSAKHDRHEASLRASAEVEQLLAIRRENVHKSRENKDAKIAQELVAKEKKLQEKVCARHTHTARHA